MECQGSKSVFGMQNAKFDIQYNLKNIGTEQKAVFLSNLTQYQISTQRAITKEKLFYPNPSGGKESLLHI